METCQSCNRPILNQRIVWLELNSRAGTYHVEGEVAAADSQGLFPFGSDCAKRILKENRQ